MKIAAFLRGSIAPGRPCHAFWLSGVSLHLMGLSCCSHCAKYPARFAIFSSCAGISASFTVNYPVINVRRSLRMATGVP